MKSKVMSEEKDWKELRMKFITATESPTLLGLDKYRSAMSMWEEKQNRTFEGNAFTKLGQILEPIVVQATNEVLKTNFELYEERHGGKVFFYDTENRLGATPDAVQGESLLECKSSNPFTWLKYAGAPPTTYLMQIQTQLHCTENEKAYLAILKTDLTQYGLEFRWPLRIYEITKNENLLNLLKQELKRFWETVEKGKSFRVSSEVKNKAKLLASLTYKRVY